MARLGWLDFWWELAALVVIMLLGHWMEMRALGQARGALSALAGLLPDGAERVRGDDTETVPISALAGGDVVLVRPGARIPADGELLSEATEFDEAMVTGEPRSVERAAGEAVVAGTVVAGSSARIRVSAVGDATRLAGHPAPRRRCGELAVTHAGAGRPRRRAALYIATGAAAITFLV